MEIQDKENIKEIEKIREAVRSRYGKIARSSSDLGVSNPIVSCCGSADSSSAAEQAGKCCGQGTLATDKISAAMGYSEEDLANIPDGANMGLGCGNPVALASLKTGETVVDLGSGGGFDCFLAARQVGANGQVIGVDMTPDMISKARRNAQKAGSTNVDFRLGEIERLPVADNSADIIMSNCVINLSADKRQVYNDAFRVLKPGGRLAISDIVATEPLPAEVRENLELVSACIGGAATIDDTIAMLKAAGFDDIKINAKEESRDIMNEYVPGTNVGQYVVSAYIEAHKPADSM